MERRHVNSIGYQKVGKIRAELADSLRWLAVARTEAHFHPGLATKAGRKTLSDIQNLELIPDSRKIKNGGYELYLEFIRQRT
jgi:hypothetical protein